ncbi:hypothetical protein INT43_002852 [Umbelopsis isabellina]|uniref:Uncharacterized protein n=1 Tax=Mortierella isabellina TaxID=91625 RepID=A0A8H7UPN2_MORIS|nr:hypothetical protein INT43_002852 [Umbelopsis isabellina]
MTHLSDFSFLQRAVSLVFLYVWGGYRIIKLDRLQCMRPSRLKQGELKSIFTYLVLIGIPAQLYYDFTSIKIKYEEGFMELPGPDNTTEIMTKPEQYWSAADEDLVIPTDYSLCVGFAIQTGTLFLLQCFWQYLVNSVVKASFLYSWEFKLYITWFFVSLALFPVLQWNFSRPQYDITYKEVIPELVYGIELFVIGVIGIFTHYRFKRLIKQTRDSLDSQTVLVKLKYFSDLNQLLTCMLLISGSAFIILSTDHLTTSMYLNAHNADLLICIANFTVVNAWFIMVLIFHPNQGYGIRSQNDPQSDYIFSHARNGVNADSNLQSGAIFRSYSTSIRENAIGTTLPDKMEHAKPMRPITAHSTILSSSYSHGTESFNMQRKHSEQISLSSISTPGGHSYPDTVPFAQAPSNEAYTSSAEVQPTLSQAAGVRLDGGNRSRKEDTRNQPDAAVYRQAQEWEDEAAVRLGGV